MIRHLKAFLVWNILIFAINSACAAPAETSVEKAEKFKKEAQECMRQKDYNGVIDAANEAIKLDPRNYTLWNFRAGGNLGLKRTEQAIADYSQSLKLQPTVLVYQMRSRIYLEMGEPRKALADIREAAKLDGSANYLIKEAKMEIELRDFDASIASSNRALSMLNTLPSQTRVANEMDCHDLIAQSYFGKKDFKKAIEQFSKALALNPGWEDTVRKRHNPRMEQAAKWHVDMVSRRGQAYEQLGMLKEAIADHELAVSILPKTFNYRRNLLRAYMKAGNNKRALALATQLLNEDDSPDLYYKRAEIYKKLGNESLAKIDLARARKTEDTLMLQTK